MTLIEVLVAVVVVGVLVGLIFPAVLSAREAARRAQCANNLRQIGAAIHSYHDIESLLPIGFTRTYDPRFAGTRPPCTSKLTDKSYLIGVLPYLEQAALYNAINHSVTILGHENRTVQSVVVGTYACPSDFTSGRPRSMVDSQLTELGLLPRQGALAVFTSYIACHGSAPVLAMPTVSTACRVDPRALAQADGPFGGPTPHSLAEVRDVLSHTLFVAERATARQRDLAKEDFGRLGWYFQGNWGDTLLTTFLPANYERPGALERLATASSLHAGGVNALLGDGSVRFIKASIGSWPIDPATGYPAGSSLDSAGFWRDLPKPGIWQALGTRAGGEALDSSTF